MAEIGEQLSPSSDHCEPPIWTCPQPVAIVGMGCRWPGSISNPSQLWDALQRKQSGYADFPKDRMNTDGWYHASQQRPGTFYTKGGFFLKEDPRLFDHTFFGMSPLEVSTMDPSQRKLLEVTYDAFENAGEPLERIKGSNIGVFVGNFGSDHQHMQYRDADYLLPHTATGGDSAILSNRINYIFDLKGPSMTINTACSSSMYALHCAMQGLRNEECDAAIVAGSNIVLEPSSQIAGTKLGAISGTSVSHTFDESADGYARADGFGALYLMPLSKALKGNYRVRAVIRGTAISSNGRSDGITHPSASGQESVIRQAYLNAGRLNPALTDYFECHGTGTPVGDPLEVEGIGKVFAKHRIPPLEPLLIGSVKPNLGHSESASAIASIMKVVLALENGMIPPTRGINILNPAIDFDGSRTRVVTESISWPREHIKRASLNSFGFGGANAHAILEHVDSILQQVEKDFQRLSPGRPPQQPATHNNPCHWIFNISTQDLREMAKSQSSAIARNMPTEPDSLARGDSESPTDPRTLLLVFSAHNQTALKANLTKLFEHASNERLQDLAYTLAVRRTQFPTRTYAISSGATTTQSIDPEQLIYRKARITADGPYRVGYVFTGQGAQWPGMGRELLHEFPLFRDSIRRHDDILRRLPQPPSWDIESILTGSDRDLIHEPEVSQTVCTSLQLALIDLLRSIGVHPFAVVGHSSGEIAAAVSAGRLTAAEALAIAYYRGYVVQRSQKQGAMLAVGLGVDDVQKYLSGFDSTVCVAAMNSPTSVTLSGDADAIQKIAESLDQDSVFNRILKTKGNAYHSHHMMLLGSEYESMLERGLQSLGHDTPERLHPTPVYWCSSVDPFRDMTRASVAPQYWHENLVSPVRFSDAVRLLQECSETRVDGFVEIGPHSALQGPLKQIFKSLKVDKNNSPVYMHCLSRNTNDKRSLLELGGQLFLEGISVDINALNGSPPDANLCIDMPTYAYTYGPIIYNESRLSKEWRLRKFPRHDLLGLQQAASPPLAPCWRNILRLKDVMWLEDHKLGQKIIFPAAGFLAMAIEAISQHYTNLMDEGSLAGLRFHNVSINSTLEVPSDDSGIELMFSMHSSSLEGVKSSDSLRFDFKITGLSPGSTVWVEYCNGSVGAEVQQNNLPCVETRLLIQETEGLVDTSKLKTALDMKRYYAHFSRLGLNYSRSFQGLSNLNISNGGCNAEVDLMPTSGFMKGESKYWIHPASIDACLQLALIASHKGHLNSAQTAYIPTMIEELTIWRPRSKSAKGTSFATGGLRGARGLYAEVQLLDKNNEIILNLEQLKCISTVDQIAIPRNGLSGMTHPFFRLTWKPDIQTLDNSEARKLFPATCNERQVEHIIRGWDEVSTLMLVSLSLSCNENIVTDELQPFIQWVQRCCSPAGLKTLPFGKQSMEKSQHERLQRIEEIVKYLKENPEIRLVKHLYDHMPAILSGELSGLEVAQEDDLLAQLYATGLGFTSAYGQLENIVDLIAHENPNLEILEIGAGTGGASRVVLQKLGSRTDFRQYQHYTFTDITPAFLTTAQESFQHHRDINFKTLNIEHDPETQGFHLPYDLVIASQVLHATEKLSETLKNTRKLLKPGGRMILLELIKPPNIAGLLFGTFPFYWKGQADGRENGPFANIERWDAELKSSGFTGVDILLDDHPGNLGIASVIVTTACEPPQLTTWSVAHPMPVALLSNNTSSEAYRAIFSLLEQVGFQPFHATGFEDVLPAPRIISLLAYDRDFDIYTNAGHFEKFKKIMLAADFVLWITPSAIVSKPDPSAAITAGLLRVISRESPQIRLIQVHVGSHQELESAAGKIANIVDRFFNSGLRSASDDLYAIQDDVLCISRIIPDEQLNVRYTTNALGDTNAKPTDMDQLGPVKLVFEKPGAFTTLKFKPDLDFLKPLQDEWVEIKSEAIELNMKDYSVATGRFDWNTYSLTCCGLITKIGANVKKLSIGDRVCGLAFGNFGNYARAQASAVQRFDLDDSPEAIASLPISYLTAIHALIRLARVQEGESVLIQSATSSLGLACIRIANHLKANIYVTVGNQTRANVLKEIHGIPEDRIFTSRSSSTWHRLRVLTGGIDVIISTSSGEHLQESWKCIAPMGRFIELGRLDVLNRGRLSMEIFERNAAFFSFDISLMYVQKPDCVSGLMQELAMLYRKGIVKPIDKIISFDISQIEQAFIQMAKGDHVGKIVVTYKNSMSSIPVLPQVLHASFDPEAAYILVGCGGSGLGQAISTWMVRRGAKHLVHLSRSPKAIPNDHEQDDAHVIHVQCDITSKENVESTLEGVRAQRPIKGVINAAAVFGDISFEKMNFTQMKKVLDPKVQGTINLHHATLTDPLEFFLMTSSVIAVINTATQSSYSAATGFQDDFARYRRSLKLPALSLALGMISDAGFVSRQPEIRKSLERNGLYGMTTDQLLELLDIVFTTPISTDISYDPLSRAHLLTGLEPSKISALDPRIDYIWTQDSRFSHLIRAINNYRNAEKLLPQSTNPQVNSDVSNASLLNAMAEDYTNVRTESASRKELDIPLELEELACTTLVERFAKSMFLAPSDIDLNQDIAGYGVDSMVAAELRNWLIKNFEVNISFGELVAKGMKIRTLGTLLAKRLVENTYKRKHQGEIRDSTDQS